MFAPYPVSSRRVATWKDMKTFHYLETKQFLEAASVEVFPEFGDLPLYTLMLEPLQSELKLECRDFLPRMAEASKDLVECVG